MNAVRWQQIKSTVVRAMEEPETERARLLDSICGSDVDLREEVDSLLAAAATAESFPNVRAAIASSASTIIVEQDAVLRKHLEGVLSHQYEIIRSIGRGGMGSVFLARERALERFVAIKVLRPELAIGEKHRERFRREARIAARLTHPGILGLHSFGEIGNLWYFVMTYVRGETLAEKIRRERTLPWAEAHRIFAEMADALDCAHRNGVVHRDIKPANILLDSDNGRAVLADFGISKLLGARDSLTATGAVMGTPDYMSPEQVTAADIDERSDIYSLGAVAYVMLTGREPFREGTAAATIYKRLVSDAVPIESLVPSVPPDLAAIVRKCMARERGERWPTARALKEALENILAVDRLPNAVRDVRSFGPWAFLWAAGWSAFAVFTARSASERSLLMLVALIVPIGLVLHLWNGAGRGMRFVELVRIALWPPEWWGLWWPRALRRPSDIWDRLPPTAKAVRILLIAYCPLLVLAVLSRGRLPSDAGAIYESWVDVVEWAILLTGIAAVAAAFAWVHGKGLDLSQSSRLLLGPTLASSGWNEPALAHMLAPAAGRVRAPDPDSPSDHLRGIREILSLLTMAAGEPTLRVADAAERLLKAIDNNDNELAAFARDAGADEADRLAARLESLEPTMDGDVDGRREMRELVRTQLDLVKRMQGRHEVVARERAHRVDLLKALWTQLHAAAVSEHPDRDAIERLALFCAEIDRDLESGL